MIRSSERWVLLAALSLSAGAWAGSQTAEQKARAEFQKGQTAYDLAQFKEALGHFSEAYLLKPLPGFLFNIGQCHRQLGAYKEAAFFFRRYLELIPANAKDAGVVKELIAEVDAALKEQERARDDAMAAAREREALQLRIQAAQLELQSAQARVKELEAQIELATAKQRLSALADGGAPESPDAGTPASPPLATPQNP